MYHIWRLPTINYSARATPRNSYTKPLLWARQLLFTFKQVLLRIALHSKIYFAFKDEFSKIFFGIHCYCPQMSLKFKAYYVCRHPNDHILSVIVDLEWHWRMMCHFAAGKPSQNLPPFPTYKASSAVSLTTWDCGGSYGGEETSKFNNNFWNVVKTSLLTPFPAVSSAQFCDKRGAK